MVNRGAVRRCLFCATFMLNTANLPRQARDKHKEKLRGKGVCCRPWCQRRWVLGRLLRAGQEHEQHQQQRAAVLHAAPQGGVTTSSSAIMSAEQPDEEVWATVGDAIVKELYSSGPSELLGVSTAQTQTNLRCEKRHLFLSLFRACLGKMIVFIYKWLKNAVFRRNRELFADMAGWLHDAAVVPRTIIGDDAGGGELSEDDDEAMGLAAMGDDY